MNLKKVCLLALLALAVLAVPASALASEWLHEGKPITSHTEFEVSGSEFIQVAGGVANCEVHATVTTEGGATGKVTSYSLTNCAGVFEELAGCEVAESNAVGLPWAVDVNEENLTVTGVRLHLEFKSGCKAATNVETTAPELIWSPYAEEGFPNRSEIALFEFQTEGGVAHVDGKESTFGNFGSVQLPKAEYGTYGIG